MPDTAWTVNRCPPGFIPKMPSFLGFDVIKAFRHFIGGSLSLAFLTHT